MAKLVKCLECGASISKVARDCPKCKTQYPRGTCCAACRKNIKRSEAIGKNGYSFDNYLSYICKKCNQKMNDIQTKYKLIKQPYITIKCNACNTTIKFKKPINNNNKEYLLDLPRSSCWECGNPFSYKQKEYYRKSNLEICYCCNNPIENDKIFLSNSYFHKDCINSFLSWQKRYNLSILRKITRIVGGLILLIFCSSILFAIAGGINAFSLLLFVILLITIIKQTIDCLRYGEM